MNYTDQQIKLAGLLQPESGPREYEDALDLQGEGIRVLGTTTAIEENTGDCCEDLQTCEGALSACNSEKDEIQGICDEEKQVLEDEITELTEENQDLQDENDELLEVVDGSSSTCAGIGIFAVSNYNFLNGTVCLNLVAPPAGIGQPESWSIDALGTATSIIAPLPGAGFSDCRLRVYKLWASGAISTQSLIILTTVQWSDEVTYTKSFSPSFPYLRTSNSHVGYEIQDIYANPIGRLYFGGDIQPPA